MRARGSRRIPAHLEGSRCRLQGDEDETLAQAGSGRRDRGAGGRGRRDGAGRPLPGRRPVALRRRDEPHGGHRAGSAPRPLGADAARRAAAPRRIPGGVELLARDDPGCDRRVDRGQRPAAAHRQLVSAVAERRAPLSSRLGAQRGRRGRDPDDHLGAVERAGRRPARRHPAGHQPPADRRRRARPLHPIVGATDRRLQAADHDPPHARDERHLVPLGRPGERQHAGPLHRRLAPRARHLHRGRGEERELDLVDQQSRAHRRRGSRHPRLLPGQGLRRLGLDQRLQLGHGLQLELMAHRRPALPRHLPCADRLRQADHDLRDRHHDRRRRRPGVDPADLHTPAHHLPEAEGRALVRRHRRRRARLPAPGPDRGRPRTEGRPRSGLAPGPGDRPGRTRARSPAFAG